MTRIVSVEAKDGSRESLRGFATNLLFGRGVRHIERFLVRRKGYTVGRSPSRVHIQKLHFTVFNKIETVEGEFFQGTIFASLETSRRAICKVNCAVGFGDDVIDTAQVLPLVMIG